MPGHRRSPGPVTVPSSSGRIVAGAVLLDLALSPLLVWGGLAPAAGREVGGTGPGLVFTGWGLAGMTAPGTPAWLATRGGVPLAFAVPAVAALLRWACVAASAVRRGR